MDKLLAEQLKAVVEVFKSREEALGVKSD